MSGWLVLSSKIVNEFCALLVILNFVIILAIIFAQLNLRAGKLFNHKAEIL